MLILPPGDAVATTRSPRSELRSSQAEFVATAKSGALAKAAKANPAPCFEDSRAGRWLFAGLMVIVFTGIAIKFAQRVGWLA